MRETRDPYKVKKPKKTTDKTSTNERGKKVVKHKIIINLSL